MQIIYKNFTFCVLGWASVSGDPFFVSVSGDLPMPGRKDIVIRWSMATAHCFADPLRLRGGCAVNFSVVAPGRGRLWVPRNQRSVTSSKSNPHKSAQTSMLITDAYKDKPPRGSPNKGERSIWSRATALSRAIWSEFVGVGKAFALISFHGLDFCCAVALFDPTRKPRKQKNHIKCFDTYIEY